MKNKYILHLLVTILIAACAKPKGALVSPTVDFTYAVDNTNPAKYNFTNTSKFANGFVWYFGDGDSSKTVNTSHIYKMAGTYNVILKAFTDNGISAITKTIIVKNQDTLIVDFTLDCPKPFGEFSQTNFINKSKNAVRYEWSYDEKLDTNKAPNYNFRREGEFSIRLRAFNAKGDSKSIDKVLTVKEKADSMIITKVTIVKTDTLQWAMYPFDFGSSPDFLVAFGNWIDTTKKRTNTKKNTATFPIVYNLASKPISLPVPASNRTNVNTIYIYDGDQAYEKYGDELSLYIADYIINPNAYPDTITIETGDGISKIILEVSWK